MENTTTDIIITGADLAGQLGLEYDAMRKRVRRLLGLSMSDPLSADQVSIVSAIPGTKKKRDAQPKPAKSNTETVNRSPKTPAVSQEEPPGKKLVVEKEPFVFPTAKAFRWTLIAGCVGHSILVANGLKILFPHGEGLIAGGFAFLVIIACLIIAHDPELPRTSQNAAWLATVIYLGAWFVHFQAFQKESPDANQFFVGCLSFFIVGMAAAAVWLVRDSKLS